MVILRQCTKISFGFRGEVLNQLFKSIPALAALHRTALLRLYSGKSTA